MSTLKFNDINKIYSNNVQAVFDFNLDIKDREFVIFVGPSGCGKSTTLRMVAGLEEITSGELYIDDRLMNYVEPKDRGIAMVFQNYALYPTMTVYKNMSFSLRIRKFPNKVLDENGNPIKVVDTRAIKLLTEELKDARYIAKHNPDVREEYEVKAKEIEDKIDELKANPSADKVVMKHMPKEEIDKRVREAAEILGLTEYLKRKPSALSGGQCQRVALGRAIVRHPKVFLMDEPLSNLDAKLRVQMRSELTRIHQEVGATTIYVTHDQTEAMTMADRIVVMKAGYIQQIDTPKEVYNHPNNLFVATFIGSPSMNVLEGLYRKEEVSVGEAIDFHVTQEFDIKLENFYRDMESKSKAIIKELEPEIETLSLKKKANQKAIDQKEKALKEAKNNLKFAEKSLKNVEMPITFGIRPEDIYMVGDSNNTKPSKPIEVDVDSVELLGQELLIYTSIEGKKVLIKVPSKYEVSEGDKIKVAINLDKVHLFDHSSTLRLPFESKYIKGSKK